MGKYISFSRGSTWLCYVLGIESFDDNERRLMITKSAELGYGEAMALHALFFSLSDPLRTYWLCEAAKKCVILGDDLLSDLRECLEELTYFKSEKLELDRLYMLGSAFKTFEGVSYNKLVGF